MMAHLLNAEVMLPPVPAMLRPGAWVVARVLRAATIATMPRWMRRMAGLRTPAQARERYGYPEPSEAHLQWRTKQKARVFDEGWAPSDAGLVESESLIGALS